MRAIDVLGNWRRGAVLADLDAKLSEAVRAATLTKKKASISLTLTLTPDPAEPTQMKLAATVTHKLPVQALPDAIFYADEAGHLFQTDPKQIELQLEKDEATGTVSLETRRLATAL